MLQRRYAKPGTYCVGEHCIIISVLIWFVRKKAIFCVSDKKMYFCNLLICIKKKPTIYLWSILDERTYCKHFTRKIIFLFLKFNYLAQNWLLRPPSSIPRPSSTCNRTQTLSKWEKFAARNSLSPSKKMNCLLEANKLLSQFAVSLIFFV